MMPPTERFMATSGAGRGGTALAMLREYTAPAHLSLESLTGLMSPSLTRERYTTVLTTLARQHQTLESQICDIFANHTDPSLVGLDAETRRKSDGLRRDLASLGHEMPEPAAPVDGLSTVPAALGAMYVCEGATLGGRIIGPHVQRVLGTGLPVTFFTSYGPDVAARWSTFRRVLAARLESELDVAIAVNTAVAVFERFCEAFAS